MAVAMLLTLYSVTLSGLKVYAIEEGKGPFAGASDVQIQPIAQAYAEDENEEKEDDDESSASSEGEGDEEFWEEIHEASSNLMLVLIALHLAGVVLSSRLHKENLVKAMLTGKKNLE